MYLKAKFCFSTALLLAGISSVNAEGLGVYAGIGAGAPATILGTSSLGLKVYGGAKVHEFPISQAGSIDLAIQGEYVNFGKTNYSLYSVTSESIGVDVVGSWTIPRVWAGWADEKLSVIVKLGTSIVSENWSYGGTSTSTGLAKGVGAEYRVLPAVGVNLMHEQFPGYSLLSASGTYHF